VSSNEIDAAPDTDKSAAFTEKVAREPASADNPIFLKLFILITPLFVLLLIINMGKLAFF
jgi:hypothetical protein